MSTGPKDAPSAKHAPTTQETAAPRKTAAGAHDEATPTIEGKLFPPSSPVEVPEMPTTNQAQDQTPDKGPLRQFEREADAKAHSDAADADGKARKIDPSTSSWADSTQPAPDKKNARTSIL